MDADAANEFRTETAAHRLGQYNAWEIAGVDALDLAWASKAHPLAPVAHRMLPHGEPSIALRRRRGVHSEITAIDLTVCGPYRRATVYDPEPGEELIAVRLKPETAAKFFDIAPADYADGSPADAPRSIYDACAASLLASESAEISYLIPILIKDLVSYAIRRDARRTPESFAAALLRRSQGRINMKQVAQAAGVSDRHLRRRFQESFGQSPKDYARQLRLTGAALEAERMADPDWALIAAAFGFHDQSHMINEFRAFLDMTPRGLHRERRALLDAGDMSEFSNTRERAPE